jgi:hypothetical protein
MEHRLRSIQRRFQEIKHDGAQLKINLDGSYHRGSKLGMELNDEKELLTIENVYLEGESYEARQRPLKTINEWTRITSARNTLRLTVAFYVLVKLLTYLTNPSVIRGIMQFIGVSDVAYAASLVATLVFLPLAYKVHRYRIERSMRETWDYALTLASRVFPSTVDVDEQEYVGEEEHEEVKYEYEHEEGEYQEELDTEEKPRSWFTVLGVARDASLEEIKAARDNHARIFHSDRLKNERPEVIVLADRHLAEVNLAYEEALKHRKRDQSVSQTSENEAYASQPLQALKGFMCEPDRLRIEKMIAEARSEERPLGHILFVEAREVSGGAAAQVIARALNVNYRSVSAEDVETGGDLGAVLTNLGSYDILFCGDVDMIKPAVTTTRGEARVQ